MTKVHECGAVVGPPRPEDDRGRQRGGDPLPTVEHQGGNHGDQHDRHGETGGNNETEPDVVRIVVVVHVVGTGMIRATRGNGSAVPDAFDRVLRGVRRGSTGLEHHRGDFGREVDVAREHTGDRDNRLLHPGRARCAGHPADREVDSGVDGGTQLRAHGLHLCMDS